jgi:hypothetical protein
MLPQTTADSALLAAGTAAVGGGDVACVRELKEIIIYLIVNNE